MFQDSAGVLIRRLLRHWANAAIVALVAFAAAGLVQYSGLAVSPELQLYDFWLWLRAAPAAEDSPVVLLQIRMKDLEEDQRPEGQITDHALAKDILEPILSHEPGPAVVGVDIFRKAVPKHAESAAVGARHPGQEQDKGLGELTKLVSEHENVIMAEYRGCTDPDADCHPREISFADPSQVGFVDYPPEPDNPRGRAARRALLYEQKADQESAGVVYSFPYLLTYYYLEPSSGSNPGSNKDYAEIGPSKSHLLRFHSYDGGYDALDDKGFQFLIDFKESSFKSKYFSAELRKDAERGFYDKKIVLIGYSADDDVSTPLQKAMPGVELNAHVVSQLVRIGRGNKTTTPVRGLLKYALILGAALAAAVYGTLVRSGARFGLCLLLNLLVILAVAYVALRYDIWIPAVPAVIAAVASATCAKIVARRWLSVFINYAREDSEQVKQVYACLRAAGHYPWIDREGLHGGDHYPRQLARAIRQSDRFLACLSSNSVRKGQDHQSVLAKEISQALDCWEERLGSKLYLIPVRLELCEIPTQLSDLNCVDFFAPGGPESMRKALQSR